MKKQSDKPAVRDAAARFLPGHARAPRPEARVPTLRLNAARHRRGEDLRATAPGYAEEFSIAVF